MAGLPVKPGEEPVQPRLTEQEFISADNFRHPVKAWLPIDHEINFAIVALHGFNDYSNAFATAGEALSQEGVAVYAYDQRGFGGTAYRGYWHGAEIMAQDLHTFISLVHERHQGVPVFVLADSMGGAVALKANAMRPLDASGMILVAPAVWGRETMPWYQRFVLWLSANTFPMAKVTGSSLGRKASDNDEMLKQLGRDPLVIHESRIGTLWGLTNLMDDALEASSQIRSSTLLLYGKNDQIIPENAVREMIKRLPKTAKKYIKIAIYENGYHMLLRDLHGDVVISDISAWMKGPSANLPSRADLAHPTEP